MKEPHTRLLRASLVAALLLTEGRALAYTDGDWWFNYSGDTATITGYSGSKTNLPLFGDDNRFQCFQGQHLSDKRDDSEFRDVHRFRIVPRLHVAPIRKCFRKHHVHSGFLFLRLFLALLVFDSVQRDEHR